MKFCVNCRHCRVDEQYSVDRHDCLRKITATDRVTGYRSYARCYDERMDTPDNSRCGVDAKFFISKPVSVMPLVIGLGFIAFMVYMWFFS